MIWYPFGIERRRQERGEPPDEPMSDEELREAMRFLTVLGVLIGIVALVVAVLT